MTTIFQYSADLLVKLLTDDVSDCNLRNMIWICGLIPEWLILEWAGRAVNTMLYFKMRLVTLLWHIHVYVLFQFICYQFKEAGWSTDLP